MGEPAAARIGGEHLGVEPVGQDEALPGGHVEQVRDPVELGVGEHDDPGAPRRPAAHALPPRLGEVPAGGGPLGDLLEHEQLGAVEVAEDGHPGSDPRRRLVERGEVVEVQDVRLARARPRERD